MTFSQERLELSTKESVRAAGVGDQRRGWQDGADVDGREENCSATGGGTCNASRRDSFFLARRRKWEEKGC